MVLLTEAFNFLNVFFNNIVTGHFHGSEKVISPVGNITGAFYSFEGTGVELFLGIPYAKPPVGDLRFALPQPFGPVGQLEAKNFGKKCPQTLLSPEFSFRLGESEDCLHLNVFRRAGTKSDDKKAVVVIVHGGGFMAGSASDVTFNGIPIVALEDVILVSFNYRLGVLGFADMKELAPGNLGLHDQRLVLEWIRDNIEAFGGDPDNVTLVGMSAGAVMVDAQIRTPLNRKQKLFQKAIMDAGGLWNNVVPAMDQDDSLRRVRKMAATLGCPTSGERMLKCLRGAPYSALLRTSRDPEFSNAFTFLTTIDGKFIPFGVINDTQEKSDIQVIVGVSQNEGTLFVDAARGFNRLETEVDFIEVCRKISKLYFYRIDLNNKTVRDALIDTYFGKSKDHFNDVAEFIADGVFNCPLNSYVKNFAKAFDHFHVYHFYRRPKGKFLPVDSDKYGAFHTSAFIHMIGSALIFPNLIVGGPVVNEDKSFMLDMMHTIAEFAKSNSTPEIREVRWPNYAQGEGILIIDDQPTIAPNLDHEDRCQKLFSYL